MTTGSWSTAGQSLIGFSDCSSNSSVNFGRSVSWVGDDSSWVRDRNLPRIKRIHTASFMREGYTPYGSRSAAIPTDYEKIGRNAGVTEDSVFEHAARKRFSVYEAGSYAAPGKDVPHYFHKVWAGLQDTPLTWILLANGQSFSGTVNNCGFGALGIPDPWTADDDYQLISRLREKIMGSDFNLGSFLGAEAWDTVRFIGNVANRLYQSIKAAKRGRWQSAVQILRSGRKTHAPSDLSAPLRARQRDVYEDIYQSLTGKQRGQSDVSLAGQLWLEYHLAAEPLMRDVEAAASQLAHVLSKERKLRIRVSVRKSVQYPVPFTGPVWTGNRTVRKNLLAIFTRAADPLGFMGFDDPATVIWNAIPLTFVSDYLVNVGGWLEALGTVRSLPPGLFVTSVKDDTRYFACLGRRFQGSWVSVLSNADSRHQRGRSGTFTRHVSSALDVPKPRVVSQKDFDPSWQRTLTILSLFAVFNDDRSKPPPLR